MCYNIEVLRKTVIHRRPPRGEAPAEAGEGTQGEGHTEVLKTERGSFVPSFKGQPKSENVEDRRGDSPFKREMLAILGRSGMLDLQADISNLWNNGGIRGALQRRAQQQEQMRKLEMARQYYLAKTGTPTSDFMLTMLGWQKGPWNQQGSQRASANYTQDQMFDPQDNVWQDKVDLGPEYGMLTLEAAKQATNKGPTKRPRRSRKKKR